MTVKGLWPLLNDHDVVRPVKGGQRLSELLEDQILIVDLARWIVEAIFIFHNQPNLGGGNTIANAASSVTAVAESARVASESFAEQQRQWGSNAQDKFVILTIFRKLCRLVTLGVKCVIGVLDSREVPRGKKSDPSRVRRRFSEDLYSDIVALFRAFGQDVLEAPGEAEALCAALQTVLLKKGVASFVDTPDGDALLYGAFTLLKKLQPRNKPSEVAAELVQMPALKDAIIAKPRSPKTAKISASTSSTSAASSSRPVNFTPAPVSNKKGSLCRANVDNMSAVPPPGEAKATLPSTSSRSFSSTAAASATGPIIDSGTDSLLERLMRAREELRNNNGAAEQIPLVSSHGRDEEVSPLKKRKIDFEEGVLEGANDAATSSVCAVSAPSTTTTTSAITVDISSPGSLNRYELAFLAALSGSDFDGEGASGTGPAKAFALIQNLRRGISELQVKEQQKEVKKRNRAAKKKGEPTEPEDLESVRKRLHASEEATQYNRNVYEGDCLQLLRKRLSECAGGDAGHKIVTTFDMYTKLDGGADALLNKDAVAMRIVDEIVARKTEQGCAFSLDRKLLEDCLPQNAEKTSNGLKTVLAEKYFRDAIAARPSREDVPVAGMLPPPSANSKNAFHLTSIMRQRQEQSAKSKQQEELLAQQALKMQQEQRTTADSQSFCGLCPPTGRLNLKKKTQDGEHWLCCVDFGFSGWIEVRKSLVRRFDPSRAEELDNLNVPKSAAAKKTPRKTSAKAKAKSSGKLSRKSSLLVADDDDFGESADVLPPGTNSEPVRSASHGGADGAAQQQNAASSGSTTSQQKTEKKKVARHLSLDKWLHIPGKNPVGGMAKSSLAPSFAAKNTTATAPPGRGSKITATSSSQLHTGIAGAAAGAAPETAGNTTLLTPAAEKTGSAKTFARDVLSSTKKRLTFEEGTAERGPAVKKTNVVREENEVVVISSSSED
ncbi:unnamed protein product [Amoebophrya sp. A120]|nr:unnamed protein product [Amoebophrya sp. A120]|eukprot:GSA120T00003467001.1